MEGRSLRLARSATSSSLRVIIEKGSCWRPSRPSRSPRSSRAPDKKGPGLHRTPARNGLTKRLKRSALLLLRGLLGGLLGRLLGSLLLSHHLLPPSPKDMDPIGFIGLAGSMWWLDVVRMSPTRTSSATPRASPRTLIDKDSETLAVCRNSPLSRVGSVASVVATTSRIAIQGVVILDEPHSRQPS